MSGRVSRNLALHWDVVAWTGIRSAVTRDWFVVVTPGVPCALFAASPQGQRPLGQPFPATTDRGRWPYVRELSGGDYGVRKLVAVKAQQPELETLAQQLAISDIALLIGVGALGSVNVRHGS
jgi:hypothetical protein